MTADVNFNQTAYEEHGQLYVGPQFLWNMFFDYASYASALVWMGLFGWSQIKESLHKFFERRRNKESGKITEQYGDQLNILQRSYDEIPFWWFAALFAVSFIIMIVITALDVLFVPWWTYLVGIITGAIVVVPLGWLYALSNFQLVRFPRIIHR